MRSTTSDPMEPNRDAMRGMASAPTPPASARADITVPVDASER